MPCQIDAAWNVTGVNFGAGVLEEGFAGFGVLRSPLFCVVSSVEGGETRVKV